MLANAKQAGIPTEAKIAGDLSRNEIIFLGHLIAFFAYFHRINIFIPQNAQALIQGYANYKKEFPNDKTLGNDYVNACDNTKAQIPAYVPGVMDTTLGLLKNQLDAKQADVDAILPTKIDSSTLFAKTENVTAAITKTVQFICQFSAAIYQTNLTSKISCIHIAKPENLKIILETWLRDHKAVKFSVSEKMEMIAELVPAKKLTAPCKPK